MYTVIHKDSGKEISHHQTLPAALTAIEAYATLDECPAEEFDWKFDEELIGNEPQKP